MKAQPSSTEPPDEGRTRDRFVRYEAKPQFSPDPMIESGYPATSRSCRSISETKDSAIGKGRNRSIPVQAESCPTNGIPSLGQAWVKSDCEPLENQTRLLQAQCPRCQERDAPVRVVQPVRLEEWRSHLCRRR